MDIIKEVKETPNEMKESKETPMGELVNTVFMLKYIYEDSKSIMSQFGKPPSDEKEVESEQLFKKISMLFRILKSLLKHLILQIDEEKYQEVHINDVKFPISVDQLILIIGVFDKAFTSEITSLLYEVVNFQHYADFRSISEINYMLIPFVADDDIKTEKLTKDFDEFKLIVRDFACEVLNLNTSFDPHIFEEK
jgi:hypothetical protein